MSRIDVAANQAADAPKRAAVIASVLRCHADLGRVPRAMEYFAWRLERDPDAPTQATVYRLFPGGWAAVLAALSAADAA